MGNKENFLKLVSDEKANTIDNFKKHMKTNKYICKHCGKICDRESSKKWIASFCSETNRRVRLMIVKIKK